MQIKTTKGDIIWSYIGTFVGLFSNIVTIPFIVYFLDSDMLGLWYVFLSIGAITNLFDFGFTITFARNITYCWSGATTLSKVGTQGPISNEPDYGLMNDILNACKKIYLIISLCVLLLMVSVGSLYIYYITSNIEQTIPIIAFIIYSIGCFLNLYYNYYDSFLRGVGAIKIANRNKVYARIVQIVSIVLLLILGGGIIGLAITFVLYGFVFRTLAYKSFYSYQDIGTRLEEHRSSYNKQKTKEIFSAIWHNAWREGVIQVSMYCCTQLSVLICSIYFTLEETGIYSLSMQIATAIATLSAVLYSTYQPLLQNAYVTKNREEIKRYMSIIICFYTLSFVIGVLITVFVGLPILRFIKPEIVISIPILLGIFANLYILKFRDCYSSYFSCTNRLVYMRAFILSSLLCVLLSYIFIGAFNWGIVGIVIAQIFSQLIYNAWHWTIRCHKELKLSLNETLYFGYNSIREIISSHRASYIYPHKGGSDSRNFGRNKK